MDDRLVHHQFVDTGLSLVVGVLAKFAASAVPITDSRSFTSSTYPLGKESSIFSPGNCSLLHCLHCSGHRKGLRDGFFSYGSSEK